MTLSDLLKGSIGDGEHIEVDPPLTSGAAPEPHLGQPKEPQPTPKKQGPQNVVYGQKHVPSDRVLPGLEASELHTVNGNEL